MGIFNSLVTLKNYADILFWLDNFIFSRVTISGSLPEDKFIYLYLFSSLDQGYIYYLYLLI